MIDTDAYEQEIARLDALECTGKELDGFARGPATFAKSQRDTFTIRLAAEELAEIAEAAASRRQTLSEFIRQSALAEARTKPASKQRRWLEPQVAEALDELVKRLGEQQRSERRRKRTPAAAKRF